MKLFAKTLEIILNGEITQKFSKWQMNRHAYEQRIYAKTAALFVLCTQSAALLGAADPNSIEAVSDFGRLLGQAFQIIDDILDYTGSPDKVGKPIGEDLRQGLFTLPVINYAEDHPHDKDIKALLNGKQGESAVVQNLIEKILNSRAIEASLQEAREHIRAGKQKLSNLPPSRYKDALLHLASEVTNRDF